MASLLEQLRSIDGVTVACIAGALGLTCCAGKCYTTVARPAPSGPLVGVKILDLSVSISSPDRVVLSFSPRAAPTRISSASADLACYRFCGRTGGARAARRRTGEGGRESVN